VANMMLPEHQSRAKGNSKYPDSSDSLDPKFIAKIRPIVIAVAFLLFCLSVIGLLLTLPLARSGRVDFRHLYTAGYMVRTGHAAEIYDYAKNEKFQNELVGHAEGALPFNHLAYESLIYVPFSFLTYQHAYFAFMAVNLIVLAASILLVQPLFSPLAHVWSLLPFAIVACFLPVTFALIQGQDSLFLLALFAASALALHSGKDFCAGILLGVTLFKFQYALPVAFLFFLWRRWRFLAGFALSAAAVSGLSVLLTGFSGFTSYLRTIAAMSAKFSPANEALYGVHPEGMPNLRGFNYVISRGSTSFTHLATLGSSVLILLCAALKRPLFGTALLAALLVSYHQMISDTSLLLLPIGMALCWSIQSTEKRSALVAALACLAFIGPAVLLFAGTRFYPLALPVLGLFILSDWREPSPKNGTVDGNVHNR
jgi:hypothetical protein